MERRCWCLLESRREEAAAETVERQALFWVGWSFFLGGWVGGGVSRFLSLWRKKGRGYPPSAWRRERERRPRRRFLLVQRFLFANLNSCEHNSLVVLSRALQEKKEQPPQP
jgi:hypothetical protein